MYRALAARQEHALRRAMRRLAEYGDTHEPQQDNPCIPVHLLVQELKRVCGFKRGSLGTSGVKSG